MKGRALENALTSACSVYRRRGIADVRKQEIRRRWDGTPTGRAPYDFAGTIVGGRSLAMEAKECELASFPLGPSHIKERQIEALRSHHQLGGAACLVIEMLSYQEIYRVDCDELADFLARPWRASLSIAWLRAYGSIVRVSIEAGKRHAWFLDVAPHPEQMTAQLAVAAEKAQHDLLPPVELFPVEAKFRRRASEPMPKPGTDAYRERIAKAMADGTERQLRNTKGKRRGGWNPR